MTNTDVEPDVGWIACIRRMVTRMGLLSTTRLMVIPNVIICETCDVIQGPKKGSVLPKGAKTQQ